MTYTKRCNCGEPLYFDERPSWDDNVAYICYDCQSKARRFAYKRKIVETKTK